MDKNKMLKKAFCLFNLLLEITDNEEIVDRVIDDFIICLEKIDDPILAANFQSYWLDIKEKAKSKAGDPEHFAKKAKLIEEQIAKIMFPELN